MYFSGYFYLVFNLLDLLDLVGLVAFLELD